MTIFEELRTPEVEKLQKRYHELFGVWTGYHWNNFGDIEEFKEYLREEIARKEKELGL